MRALVPTRIRWTTLFLHARLGLVAAISLVASRAAAAPSTADTATAETLFRQAKNLIKQGKFSEACPKLVESNRLDPASGTLLDLATCYEGEGKMASAWLALEEVKTIADREKRSERVNQAQERLAKVQMKLSRLTVNVSAEALVIDGLEVRRDDSVLAHAALGVAVPVDQGTHLISASAKGFEPFMIEVHVGSEGDQKTVEVPMLKALPAPAPAPSLFMLPPPPPSTPAPPPPRAPSPVRLPTNKPTKGSFLRTTGVLTGGVGLASITIGTIFGVLAKVNDGEAKELCPVSPCGDQGGVKSNTKALVDAKVANIMIGAGAGLLALGTILYVISPRQPPASGRRAPLLPRVTAFEPTASAAGAGLSLGGTF